MSEMLDRYNDIQAAIATLQAEAAGIEAALREQVEASGTVAGHGWIAHMKRGRKSTDHEAAVKAAFETYDEHQMHMAAMTLHDLKHTYTTTKVTTAWAQVTKAAGLDLEPYTTQAPPVFVVEPVK